MLLAVASVWSTANCPAADAIPGDRRMPPEVVGFLRIDSIQNLKQKWAETALGELGKLEEMAPFWDELKGPIETFSEQIENQVGLSLKDILTIPQGELAIAVLQPKGQKISVAALLDFGENREAMQKLLDKADEAALDEGAKRSEVDFEGATIVVYSQKLEDGAPKTAEPVTVAHCIKDSVLIIGSRAETLKSILTRWDVTHDQTFAEEKIYSYIKSQCRTPNSDAEPPLIWYIDPVGIAMGVISSAGGANAFAAIGVVSALGLDKFKGIGGTVELATEEFDSVSRTMVYMEPKPTGVLKFLQFPASPQAPPKWASAEASTYFSINWDVSQAFAAVDAIYDMVYGAGAMGRHIDTLAEDEEGPHVHIKSDIIDQLTGTIQVVGEPGGEQDDGERYVVALELKDEAKMGQILATLAKLPEFPGKPREFEGTTIYEISAMGADDEEDEEAAEGSVGAVAIHGKQLLLATDVTLLEAAIRPNAGNGSLAETPMYQSVAKQYPAQTSSISFQRTDLQLKSLYESFQSGDSEDLFGLEIDFTRLPVFEVVRPYLTPSGSYLRPDERGLFMNSFSLHREGKK